MTFSLKTLAASTLFGAALLTTPLAMASANAAEYVIDSKGMHASVNFRIKHLGYSWLTGRFDKFAGTYSFDDANPSASKIAVEIDTQSINSNNATRDKHLRSGDFLDVSKFPTAKFVSTSMEIKDKTAIVYGKLTLHGVTKDIAIKADYVGGGKDPWGGFRTGFTGTTKFALADYGIKYNLGPDAKEVELRLEIEGVRK